MAKDTSKLTEGKGIKNFIAEILGIYKEIPVIKYKYKTKVLLKREVIWIDNLGRECSCDISNFNGEQICNLMKSINKSWKPKL